MFIQTITILVHGIRVSYVVIFVTLLRNLLRLRYWFLCAQLPIGKNHRFKCVFGSLIRARDKMMLKPTHSFHTWKMRLNRQVFPLSWLKLNIEPQVEWKSQLLCFFRNDISQARQQDESFWCCHASSSGTVFFYDAWRYETCWCVRQWQSALWCPKLR